MKHLATAETQLRALHMGTAWRNEMYRTCRLEKDNGFAEHIRLATGATHDTGRCSLEVVEWVTVGR